MDPLKHHDDRLGIVLDEENMVEKWKKNTHKFEASEKFMCATEANKERRKGVLMGDGLGWEGCPYTNANGMENRSTRKHGRNFTHQHHHYRSTTTHTPNDEKR